jgi:hypothetical protein
VYIHIIEDMAFLEGSDALGQRPVLAAEVVGFKSHPVHFYLRGNYGIRLSLFWMVVGQNLPVAEAFKKEVLAHENEFVDSALHYFRGVHKPKLDNG